MAKQILEFIQNHWALSLAALAILALLIFEEIKDKLSGVPKISVQDATLFLSRENAKVIDLRNQTAFSNGHILGSINIDSKEIDHQQKKLETHKNHPLILVDDNGVDAPKIGSKLQKMGFSKIYILSGGLNAWKSSQLPLSKD